MVREGAMETRRLLLVELVHIGALANEHAVRISIQRKDRACYAPATRIQGFNVA